MVTVTTVKIEELAMHVYSNTPRPVYVVFRAAENKTVPAVTVTADSMLEFMDVPTVEAALMEFQCMPGFDNMVKDIVDREKQYAMSIIERAHAFINDGDV